MLVYKFHNILALLIQQTPFYDRYQKDGCSVILLSSSVTALLLPAVWIWQCFHIPHDICYGNKLVVQKSKYLTF